MITVQIWPHPCDGCGQEAASRHIMAKAAGTDKVRGMSLCRKCLLEMLVKVNAVEAKLAHAITDEEEEALQVMPKSEEITQVTKREGRPK